MHVLDMIFFWADMEPGRPAVMLVPKLAIKARFGGELGEVITGGQRAVPRRALDGGFEFAHPEVEPALRSLLDR